MVSLITLQKELVNALICTLTNMFCVKLIHPDERDDDKKIEYVLVGSTCINVASIEHHIRDKWYASGEYFDRLGVDD